MKAAQITTIVTTLYGFNQCVVKQLQFAGADPEVEEGGGRDTYRFGLVWPCGARSAPNFFANV